LSRRIKIDSRTQLRETDDLTRQLKGVEINYRFGIIDKRRAKRLGARIITDHYNLLLSLSRSRLGLSIQRSVSLSPENKLQLNAWRKQAIRDFGVILDDAR
jgi:hypothetical protein